MASVLNRRARSSPPSCFTLTSLGWIPSGRASAFTMSFWVTVDSLRWVMSEGESPACVARARSSSAMVALVGVGDGAGVPDAEALGVAEADAEGDADGDG